jgi:DNA-binding NtrC family response regulator
MARVLVVDDRVDVLQTIAEDLEDSGFQVVTARDGAEGWSHFREFSPNLIITDLRMPNEDGIDLLRRVRTISSTPVILLTAYGDIPTAVEAMRSGATEFLTFPEELDRAIERARELLAPDSGAGEASELQKLLPGRSASIRRVRDRVLALAPLGVPVLVCGEAGSGRDTVVEAVHRLSRADQDLVRIRATDPAANDEWSRKLDAPVYLDQVEHHPPEAQKHWAERLRNIGPEARVRGFRLFASSCADLAELAREGTFHAGFADALRRFTVSLPSLRDRTEDLSDLVAVFVERITRTVGRTEVRVLPAALARFRSYSWPGNLRELASVLERLVAFSRDGTIGSKAVDQVLRESVESVASFRSRRERIERDELIALLRKYGGNLAAVARHLGMSRSAVHYRVRKHGLLTTKKRS